MKVKELIKMPEERKHHPDCKTPVSNETWCDCGAREYNKALLEVGDVEVPQRQELDEDLIIYKSHQHNGHSSRDGTKEHGEFGEIHPQFVSLICQRFSKPEVPSVEDILQEFSKLPNYEDVIPDEIWNAINKSVKNSDKEIITQIMQLSTKMTHKECATAIRQMLIEKN